MPYRSLLIFSDLDGTLLDHHSYSWEAARPALERLAGQGIPLILNTSKTAAEVVAIHREMQLDAPYVVENGAAVILPEKDSPCDRTAHIFGRNYSELLDVLSGIRQGRAFDFTGFSDMSAGQVAAATGLAPGQALLAKQRTSTEPLIWNDSADLLPEFRARLSGYGLKLVKGGRFYHVLDQAAGKGRAMRWILNHFFRDRVGADLFTVALGDGPNDLDMLEQADLAVVIPAPSGIAVEPRTHKILHATAAGPEGWNRAVLNILDLHDKRGVNHG
jgi:mannosyl-3-phosphoglycerate phosphatase